MNYYCGNYGCPNWAVLRCAKCVQLAMPNSSGQYCSRDCQMASLQPHNFTHTMVETANASVLSFQGIAESIAFSMKDAAMRYLLPDLGSSQTVSILLAGCRDFVEGGVDYYILYELLVTLEVFPNNALQYLEVTLCGPELTSRGPFYHPSGRLKVFRANGRLQRQFPTSTTNIALPDLPVNEFSSTTDKVVGSHYTSFNTYNGAPAVASAAALVDIFSCVFIRQPGFAVSTEYMKRRSPVKENIVSMLEQWSPAIKLLLETGVLVLVAEYPAQLADDAETASWKAEDTPITAAASLSEILPPLSPVASSAASKSRNGRSTSRGNIIYESPDLTENHHHPSALPTFSAEHFLDKTFSAKIVIPATLYPFKRQKWSTPFPSMLPDGASVPHSQLYAPPLTPVQNAGGDMESGGGLCEHMQAGTWISSRNTQNEQVQVRSAADNSSTHSSPSKSAEESTIALNGYYIAFQGQRDARVTHQIQFYTHMASLNAHLRGTCTQLAYELGAGRLHLPLDWSSEELELNAHRRDMAVNPLKKKLLEKEKQSLMKEYDQKGKPSPSADASAPTLQFKRR